MKVDLDTLEAVARKVASGSPDVTLALVARIRELESALLREGDALRLSYAGEDAAEREDIRSMSRRMLALVVKGVTL